MSHLYIVQFKHDTSRALHVLHQLRQFEGEGQVNVEYGIAVHREADGTLHVQEGDELATDLGTARGALVGAVIGLLFAIPFVVSVRLSIPGAMVIGAASLLGAALGSAVLGVLADSWRTTTAAERDVVRDLGTLVLRGDSVIGVLIDAPDPIAVETLFSAYEGVVLDSSLSSENAAQLERYLSDRSERVNRKAA